MDKPCPTYFLSVFEQQKKWVEWLRSDKRSEGDLFDSRDQQSAITFTCCLSQNEFQELVMKLILSSWEDFSHFTIQCNIKRFYFLSGCICSEEYFLSWHRRLLLLIISTIWDIRHAELLMGKMNTSVHSWFKVCIHLGKITFLLHHTRWLTPHAIGLWVSWVASYESMLVGLTRGFFFGYIANRRSESSLMPHCKENVSCVPVCL